MNYLIIHYFYKSSFSKNQYVLEITAKIDLENEHYLDIFVEKEDKVMWLCTPDLEERFV